MDEEDKTEEITFPYEICKVLVDENGDVIVEARTFADDAKDPGVWASVLIEVAKAASQAFEQELGYNKNMVLSRIIDVLGMELEKVSRGIEGANEDNSPE